MSKKKNMTEKQLANLKPYTFLNDKEIAKKAQKKSVAKRKQNKKPIPWLKIKKEYLEGVKPVELAKKYNTTSNTIRSKACKENWGEKKTAISNNLQQNVENRINGLTNKAFNALEQVLDDENAEYKDKVAAAKAVIDVSGLKKDKHEVKNLTPQILVADEKHKEILEQIKNADLN